MSQKLQFQGLGPHGPLGLGPQPAARAREGLGEVGGGCQLDIVYGGMVEKTANGGGSQGEGADLTRQPLEGSADY